MYRGFTHLGSLLTRSLFTVVSAAVCCSVVDILIAVVHDIHLDLSTGQAENQYWSRPPKLVLVV